MEEKDSCYHVPVMLRESLEGLDIRPDGIYVPEDVEIQKDKRVSSAKEILKKDIDGKNSHDAWRDEIFDYLSMKHIQGFYIYWMNKMII